jgi:uncharacterized membrane protein YkvA (DUF1232 family)
MGEIAKYVRSHASHITPRMVENIVHHLPMLKLEFAQIHAPKFPHLVDQLEFLADAVEDFAEEAYKDLPYVAMASATFAIMYGHKTVDIIPNFIPDLGYADNSSIVRAVLIEHERAFSKYANDMGFDWSKITNLP